MSDHESVRKMLPLAAAGALDGGEIRQVEQHVRECDSCAHEWEIWRLYAQGLGQQPQPVLPSDLVLRTQARILNERAMAMDRRRDAQVLSILAVFSFASSMASWSAVYALTGGAFVVFGTNWVSPIPWFLISGVLVWMTAAVAALTLGRRDLRRTYGSIQ
jgi:hypothetical protein